MRENKYHFLLPLLFALSSCSVSNNTTRQAERLSVPPGMVYVPAGSVMMKQTYGNSDTTDSSEMKKVSLSAFYMDRAEITNKQYRQFVEWVRDSVAVTDYVKDKKFFINRGKKDTTNRLINWGKVDDKSLWKSHNDKTQKALQGMYYQGDERTSAGNEVNPGVLNYRWQTVTTRIDSKTKKRIKVVQKDSVNVWPDESVWVNDFPNSQNDFMVKTYFAGKAFDEYPVVGISWKQARAYAMWKTKKWASYQYKKDNGKRLQVPIDLPTEAQWLYAATIQSPKEIAAKQKELEQRQKESEKAGKSKKKDSSKQQAAKKKKPEAVAYGMNFKQGEGQYGDDGATYTSPAISFKPNYLGLYNMNGNVSEWTLNAYTMNWQGFVNDLNPVLLYDAKDTDPDIVKRKVVKGGSWKDPGSLASPDSRNSEFQDVAKSYIGFRCVMPALEVFNQNPKKSKKH